MKRRSLFNQEVRKPTKKKTRQGKGRHTKYGNKLSNKHYIKRYRGQGNG